VIILAKTKKKTTEKKSLPKISTFSDGLRYPWGVPKRLWNILWALIPVLGWLALIGYSQNIIRAIVAGNKKDLPEFISFGENLRKGFLLFVKMLPLVLAYFFITTIPVIGGIAGFVAVVFFMPYLIINLFITDDFGESFNIKKVWDNVFNNLEEYLIAYLKMIGFTLVYGILLIILIGIPCLQFGCWFFLAEFYTNHN